MIDGLLLRIVLILVACVAVAGGTYMAYDWAYDRGYEAARAKYETQAIECEAKANADRAQAKARYEEAQATIKEQERRWNNRLQEVRNEYAVAQDVVKRQLAKANADNRAVRAQLGELRNSLAAYAAGAPQASGSTPATDRDRAVALGVLLEEAVGVADEALSFATEAAAGAESAGDGVRALRAAWPVP